MLGSSSKDRGRSSLLSAPLGRQGRDGLARKARARGAGRGERAGQSQARSPGSADAGGRASGRAGGQALGIRARLRPACRAERAGAGLALRLHCGPRARGVRPAPQQSRVNVKLSATCREGEREGSRAASESPRDPPETLRTGCGSPNHPCSAGAGWRLNFWMKCPGRRKHKP